MEFFNSAVKFLESLKSLNDNDDVWRGEDGSYAVGSCFPIEVEEGETEYIEAGKVEEYKF
jgi:hypothetical protein